jgi:hypothetical protein
MQKRPYKRTAFLLKQLSSDLFYPHVFLDVQSINSGPFDFFKALLGQRIVLNRDCEFKVVTFPFTGAAILEMLSVLITLQIVPASTSHKLRIKRILALIKIMIQK